MTNKTEDIHLVRTSMLDILQANNEIVVINDKTTEYYAYDVISSGMKYFLYQKCGQTKTVM